ncbi:MAG: tRNA (adenine-N1)-methyltransferase [Candidatus Thermoplasmatota archaeon]|nr:tRNA (adenine-N1)-methyltransferase [Candidatus Thermoplasmatota archaeon]
MVNLGDVVGLSDGNRVVLVKATGKVEKIGRLGIVDTSILIGARYGQDLVINETPYHIIQPNLEDRLDSISRKAQIVTIKDIGVLLARTGIGAGDLVVEAGAGSGSLTIALCHAVSPGGRVVTYELRDDFAQIARKNVDLAGFSDVSTIKLGDACDGFEERDARAVVMDIPEPWKAAGHAMLSLGAGGVAACYVPTFNQAEETVRSLRKAGFARTLCTETIEREMDVGDRGARPSFAALGHTGYVITARKLGVEDKK